MKSEKPEFVVVVLAAGQGVRMRSLLAKVLHLLNGKPLIKYALEPVLKLGASRNIIVVGHDRDKVVEALKGYPVEFAVQDEQKGTGHAVSKANELLEDYDKTVMILPGDVPLLKVSTLDRLIRFHAGGSYTATVLAGVMHNPSGYGRIVRNGNGELTRIVEERDATPEEKLIAEVNSGVYCFEYTPLKDALSLLRNENDQGEYYLTDTISILKSRGMRVGVMECDGEEILGINTVEELKVLEKKMKDASSRGSHEKDMG